MDEIEKIAHRMYTTYCKAVGGKAFNGDNLPTAEEFFSDSTKEKQANAWREVAIVEAELHPFQPFIDATGKSQKIVMDLAKVPVSEKTYMEKWIEYLNNLDITWVNTSVQDFGWAIKQLKAGNKVCRQGWNGKGMWLGLQVPDANSKMGLPYIYMKVVTGELVPWLASQTDMIAEDYIFVT